MLGSRRAQRTSSHLQKKRLGRESGKLVLAMLAINGVAHLVLLGMSCLSLARCSRRARRRRCRRRTVFANDENPLKIKLKTREIDWLYLWLQHFENKALVIPETEIK